jgi:hypothetical protein
VSVQSQSVIYARPNRIAERMGFKLKPSGSEIDEIAEHIADFSIAGVRAIGRTARSARVRSEPPRSRPRLRA